MLEVVLDGWEASTGEGCIVWQGMCDAKDIEVCKVVGCLYATWRLIIIFATRHKNVWCSFKLLIVGSLIYTECVKGSMACVLLNNLLRYSPHVHMSCRRSPQTVIGNSPLNTGMFTNKDTFFSRDFFLEVQQNTRVCSDLRVSSQVGEGKRYHLQMLLVSCGNLLK